MQHCKAGVRADALRLGLARRLEIPSGFVIVITIVLTASLMTGCQRAESGTKPAAPATASSSPSGEAIEAQAIRSRASDRYEYLGNVLNQLASHPQATCREEVAGPLGLQELLSQARTLKAQGKAHDAELVLVAMQNRLDRKFKMECLKLG